MTSTLASLEFDKTDIYLVAATIVISVLLMVVISVVRKRLPELSVRTLQDLASLFNTKGGIIILLSGMWIGCLVAICSLGVWGLVRGIDPSNAIIVTIFGVLIGTAFGTVNGALFKTMTGEEPSKASSITETKTSTVTTPPEAAKPIPTPKPPDTTPSSV